MSTELALIEVKNPALVFVANGCDPLIERIKAEVKKEAPNLDISTPAGRDAIRSLAFKIAKSKTKLDEIGKDLTEEQRKAITAVNAERSRVWDELEALQEEVRAPLTAWENAEKLRVAAHEGAIKSLVDLGVWDAMAPPPTADQIDERLKRLPDLYQRDWQEFGARATQTHDTIQIALHRKYETTMKVEAEQAELVRLRAEDAARQQKARDDKIAEDARIEAEEKAEQARKAEAEKVAREKQEAEEKAEADRKAAAAREENERQEKIAAQKRADDAERKRQEEAEQAERDRVAAADRAEREKQEASARAAQQERDRIAKEKADEEKAAQAREADKKHKAKINNDILQELISHLPIDDDTLKKLITLIAQGKVPHVKITY